MYPLSHYGRVGPAKRRYSVPGVPAAAWVTVRIFRACLSIVLLLGSFSSSGQAAEGKPRTLIVIFDGLRPDYITPELMPNVFQFRKNASYGLAHHSVFPTVTRVNASSYVTGSYPHRNGLMGNTVYFPEVDSVRGLNTGEAGVLMRINAAVGNRLLTAKSLGEILQQEGMDFMVFSSGSSGQAFIQNHEVAGGGVVNPGVILPASLKEDIVRDLGMPPASASPNTGQHEWATRALLQYGLAPDGPLVSAIWFSDPDGTAYHEGIGSPAALAAIRAVDGQFGAILDALREKRQEDNFNIIMSADHGFVTEAGSFKLGDFLVKHGLKKDTPSDDVVLAGSAIYVKGHDRDKIAAIVSLLQQQPWIGALFTRAARAGDDEGWVKGTLSLETIYADHPTRAADIVVDYNWDQGKNEFGYEGRALSPGVAGHGGSSPYEINIPLIASGPSFKKGYESAVPTSNIDIVPTILSIYDLPVPLEMEGRVLKELLAGQAGYKIPKVKKETRHASAKFPWGSYEVTIQSSVAEGHRYVDFTMVTRK